MSFICFFYSECRKKTIEGDIHIHTIKRRIRVLNGTKNKRNRIKRTFAFSWAHAIFQYDINHHGLFPSFRNAKTQLINNRVAIWCVKIMLGLLHPPKYRKKAFFDLLLAAIKIRFDLRCFSFISTGNKKNYSNQIFD